MKRFLVGALAGAFVAYAAWQIARSRTFQFFGEIVPRVETQKKVVALTFDDGPRADVLEPVLASLKGNKATFFVCGAELRDHPGVAETLVAHGHELGNHSFSHKRMVLKSPSFIASEIERTDALIRKAGHTGAIHFRAPHCKKLVGLPWYLKKTNRTHVTFDVEPETFKEIDGNAAKITSHVLDNVQPGSIVLLHPWYRGREATRAAIAPIIDGLKARGYELVTVSELLTLR